MDQAGITIRQFIKKYSNAFLVLFLGIMLMLLPKSEKKDPQLPASASVETIPVEQTLQEDLSIILSQMEGAGNVRILLTQAEGTRIVYQTDGNASGSSTVILTDSSRKETGLICQVDPPTYLGAVVLCQGADYPSVKLAITQAVSSVTGLGYDKITVLKMK